MWSGFWQRIRWQYELRPRRWSGFWQRIRWNCELRPSLEANRGTSVEVVVPSDEALTALVITEYTIKWWGAGIAVDVQLRRFVRMELRLANWVSVYRRRGLLSTVARHIVSPTHPDLSSLWDAFNWGYAGKFWGVLETRRWVAQYKLRESLALRPPLQTRCAWHDCVLWADGGRELLCPPPLGSGRWSDLFCCEAHQLLHAYRLLLALPAPDGSAWFVDGGPHSLVHTPLQ